jgi:hypothetical protein
LEKPLKISRKPLTSALNEIHLEVEKEIQKTIFVLLKNGTDVIYSGSLEIAEKRKRNGEYNNTQWLMNNTYEILTKDEYTARLNL